MATSQVWSDPDLHQGADRDACPPRSRKRKCCYSVGAGDTGWRGEMTTAAEKATLSVRGKAPGHNMQQQKVRLLGMSRPRG